VKEARRESAGVQRGPEAVAGAGEVEAGGGRVEAGVDAAKKDLQLRRDDIAQAFVYSVKEISLAGPA
jgi:hypothetical protein